MTKTSLVFRPIRDLELHLANMMTAAGIVFERHVRSAGLFPLKPTTSPLMNDPCTNAEARGKPKMIVTFQVDYRSAVTCLHGHRAGRTFEIGPAEREPWMSAVGDPFGGRMGHEKACFMPLPGYLAESIRQINFSTRIQYCEKWD